MAADSTDYPRNAADRGRVEPAPRRVRGYCNGALVFDTTAARYVWELPYYPQYYIPLADVRTEHLVDEDHPQRSQFGPFRLHAVVAGDTTVASSARVFDADGDGLLPGYVRFEWTSLQWFEEDERIVGHPRNPYSRVDALRSHRHVVVELDGTVLAESHSPVLLFETGLPTRYYVDRTDVNVEHLVPSETQTLCPYKGTTTGYWSVRTADAVHPDLAWVYDYPLPAVAAIAGMVAFYNEKVDITVDGVRLARPATHFS
ncbi:DUF427 domain-containing protein [Mycolicibacterium cosmeticum]|uniref:Acyl-CoA thioesterase n=1 Tax=Mycolicibacterium cosmeticum TaxID=258533 RepID=W9AWA1_MYCCO|nr:DUF427 domain-containing protein [Mycolicibacterium cosmeticum]TLH68056.1 DUF427 domain-containing protein [Mycolicibacterium cosmeticum]CDO06876.1 acyl-CoA thioesterase [Mycolicibacterium cosmeticum]